MQRCTDSSQNGGKIRARRNKGQQREESAERSADSSPQGGKSQPAYAAAGLSEVPAVVFRSEDETDILEALVLCNRQRTKTNEQVGREYAALRWVYNQRNKGQQKEESLWRQRDSSLEGGKIKPAVAAAETLGVSLQKATDSAKTVQVIDELREEGKAEEAEAIRETLNRRGAAPAR